MTIIEAIQEAKKQNCRHIIRERDKEWAERRKLYIRIPDGITEHEPLILTSKAYNEGEGIPRWNPATEDILANDWIVIPSDDVCNEIQ